MNYTAEIYGTYSLPVKENVEVEHLIDTLEQALLNTISAGSELAYKEDEQRIEGDFWDEGDYREERIVSELKKLHGMFPDIQLSLTKQSDEEDDKERYILNQGQLTQEQVVITYEVVKYRNLTI